MKGLVVILEIAEKIEDGGVSNTGDLNFVTKNGKREEVVKDQKKRKDFQVDSSAEFFNFIFSPPKKKRIQF